MGIIVNPEQESRPSLHGPLFRLVRVVWVLLAVLTLGIFFTSVLTYFRQIGRPVEFYAVYGIAIDTVQVLVYFLAAAAIFQRKSDDWMAVLVSTALLTVGVASLPTLEALVSKRATWQWPVDLVQGLGVGLILFVFYLFPDGRFVPHWTRPVAFLWVGWLVAWAVFPAVSVDRGELPLVLRYLSFLVWPAIEALSTLQYYLRVSSLLVVMLSWFGSGVFAQIYRYTHVSSPVQRQQTKWVVFGLTAGVVGYFGFQIPILLIPALRQPGLPRTLFYLIGEPVSALLMILAPLSISVSILRRRLWDIDPIIKSTLVYGILTGGVTIIYLGGVFVFQRLFRALTGQQSDAAIVIATLVSASLVRPLSRRLQNAIDRLFYRERVDFRRAITTFSREVRTIIDLSELLRVLVVRTTDLLHITHGAVYLLNSDGTFQQARTHNLPPNSGKEVGLFLSSNSLDSLLGGRTVSQARGSAFAMLVPLIAPRTEGSDLVGVLALGPRLSGQTYSREDRALLMGLADQAGTAIRVAQLIQEKEGEARRREEVERRLEAYRNSPLGRAEAFARELLFEPEGALVELHRLAQAAGQDPNAASLIDNLPQVLDGMRAGPIARLAEGFNYLLTSRVEPEVLPVGLRTLTAQLEDYPVEGLEYVCRWDPKGRFMEDRQPRDKGLRYAAEALAAYQLSHSALQVNSVGQITQLLPSLEGGQEEMATEAGQTASTTIYEPFQTLTQALFRLRPVAEALYAFERMDTAQDKLSYLASAVERLRRVEHLSRTELGSADRPVVQRIAESWLTVITGAISELQTRAEIVCRLLTRHTWQEDVVPLVLTLRNDGRGVALNVKVTLVPKPEYTMLVQSAQIDQIVPGEEVRVELRVRPHLPDGVDRFRARFVIAYADPRGSDQVENFADVVRLLAGEREFQFIPNPYVVGTPLEAGSSLFFGREDVIGFIQENMAALHRNNLVLIGQRRTGKTSLLKQLPVRLGDDYLPVYLDGQALGLDPGLPNFFLALATEIAFALEDRGFAIDLPQYEDFVDSPATSFERGFLGSVRQTIGDRHLLIMFDEFEELESAVDRGNLDSSIFGFLRHLVQHSDNLSVIFCGTHRLEELASDYWNVLFNISLYRQIAFLEQPEALRLIQEPVAEYGMRYDDLALDKIWRVTAGHPYFLQLLCHSLVNRHNKTERNYITISDVNAALDEILASGEAHFVYLWTEATPEQRLILAVLSRMIPLTGRVTLVQVVDYLAERGVNLERRAIGDGLHYLTLRNILTATSDADPVVGETYGWRLGLLGLWVERYRSLTRVVEGVVGAAHGAARLENE